MADKVRLEPTSRIRVLLDGTPIVDTSRGFTVHEQGLPPRYYVPRDAVRADLVDGAGGGTCPWKGQWRNLDVVSAGKRTVRAAWTYSDTTPVCEPIRDFVSFYGDKLTIEVEA